MSNSIFYKWSKNGNKMIIESRYKTFNKQTNLISNGNVISNTQYSNFIHKDNKKYDLRFFNMPSELRDFVDTINDDFILYEFFIHSNDKKTIVGHIVEINKIIVYCQPPAYAKNYSKKADALALCANIIGV